MCVCVCLDGRRRSNALRPAAAHDPASRLPLCVAPRTFDPQQAAEPRCLSCTGAAMPAKCQRRMRRKRPKRQAPLGTIEHIMYMQQWVDAPILQVEPAPHRPRCANEPNTPQAHACPKQEANVMAT